MSDTTRSQSLGVEDAGDETDAEVTESMPASSKKHVFIRGQTTVGDVLKARKPAKDEIASTFRKCNFSIVA